MKTIKIFIASSNELIAERKELANLAQSLSFALERQGLCFQTVQWEFMDASHIPYDKQEMYNNELKLCDICIALFWTKFGKFTKREFDTAITELSAGRQLKKLYTYCKKSEAVKQELKAFKESYYEKYHDFVIEFENFDTLKAHFLLQVIIFLSEFWGESKFVEIKNSMVTIDGKVYVDLLKVPFAGNNEEYTRLIKEIERTERLIAKISQDDPDYQEYATVLLELKEKQSIMEDNMWNTATYITQHKATMRSDRLKRAITHFNQGDLNGANAILDEEKIDRDVEHNLELLDKGKEGLKSNIEEYKLKIKLIEAKMPNGWTDKIVELQEKILSICLQTFGEKSAEAADAYYSTGYYYVFLGNYEEALKYFNKALELREGLFKERHPKTASAISKVGILYSKLGDQKKALEYQFNALNLRTNINGERHPKTASAISNVGITFEKLGIPEKALEYFLKALNMRIEIYGKKHPETAAAINNVGIIYSKLGDQKRALEYFLEALNLRTEIFGERHPETVAAISNVAIVYSKLGDQKKALVYFLKALNLRIEIYGERHPETTAAISNVAIAYSKLGDQKKALEYFLKVLNLRTEIYGERHSEIAAAISNLAITYGKLRDTKKALEYQLKALNMRTEIYGERHPKTAATISNVGIIYSKIGDQKKALEYFLKALNLRTEIYGERHPETAAAISNVGITYGKLGDQKKALEYKLKALNLRIEIYGENHPVTASSFRNLGITYDALGEHEKAKVYFRLANKSRREFKNAKSQ